MLKSAPQSPRSKMLKGKQFLSFLDVDDTCVFWRKANPLDPNSKDEAKFKNFHLLGPVLLAKTFAENQHIGFLTTRPPSDNLVDYTVKLIRQDLASFGIDIPEEHVIFGGAENNSQNEKLLRVVEEALEMLPEQFASLRVTEKGEALSLQGPVVQQALLELLKIKAPIKTKNCYIIDFLNAHLQKDKSYTLCKGNIPQENLIVGLVDDMKDNADGPKELGNDRFFGIKASRGGNPPKEGRPEEDFKEYYGVDYLYELAHKIGFKSYCDSFLQNSDNHHDDHPMLQMAALLYLWQTSESPMIIRGIKEVEKRLKDVECEQIAKMLDYTISLKIANQYAKYKPVDELVEIFRPRADRHFVETMTQKLSEIDNQIAALTAATPAAPQTTDEPPQLVRSKSKLPSIFKRPSINKTALTAASSSSIPETPPEVKLLLAEKAALIARLERIVASKHPLTNERAERCLKSINFRSSDEAAPAPSRTMSSRLSSNPTAISSSSSSSSSASGMNTPVDDALLRRRSFTPAAKNHADNSNGMRSVSSLDSFAGLMVDAEDPPAIVKKDKEKDKKAGSNLKF